MGELTERINRLLAQKGGAMLSDHRRALAREIVAELGKPSAAMVTAAASLYPSGIDSAALLRAMVAAELGG